MSMGSGGEVGIHGHVLKGGNIVLCDRMLDDIVLLILLFQEWILRLHFALLL